MAHTNRAEPFCFALYAVAISALAGCNSVGTPEGANTQADTDPGYADPCEATDAASFGACVSAANKAGATVSEIEVTQPIVCDDGDNKCEFALVGIDRPFLVIGKYLAPYADCNGTTVNRAGFCRSGEHGGYTGTTLAIRGSTGPISIEYLPFDEGTNQPLPWSDIVNLSNPEKAIAIWTNQISTACKATEAKNPCPGQSLSIGTSSNVYVSDSDFLEAKDIAVSIWDSSHIVFRHNTLRDAFTFGISAKGSDTAGLHIEDNVFSGTRVQALLIAANQPAGSDPIPYNSISNNSFYDNSNAGVFWNANINWFWGTGGQLAISDGDHWWIENNTVSHNGLDGTVTWAEDDYSHGMEFYGTSLLSHVVVTNNLIEDGNMTGINFDTPTQNPMYDMKVYKNYFYDLNVEFKSVAEKSIFTNEWFLNSGQNEYDNNQYPNNPPEYVLSGGGNCSENANQDAWDWGNCYVDASFDLTVPTGTISSAGCTLGENGTCTATILWTGSGPLKVVQDESSTFATSNGNGSKSATLTNQPTCFDLYSSYTSLAGICLVGTN